ncbi:MAG: hypothetical protein JXQ73_09990 [Phycisphaerae bacterium]|nr:hypothetical protein [Phycisphaerae bacterium]
MRWLRWILLASYVALVLLLAGSVAKDLLGGPELPLWIGFVALSVFVQVFFILAPGRPEYLTPIGPRRLIAPVVIAGLMMAILAFGFYMSLVELIWGEGPNATTDRWWLVSLIAWVFWGALFYIRGRSRGRHRAMRGMVAWMIGGSLLELLVSVPAHVVVMRRPGCFVMGMSSLVGIAAGIYVMAWAFGPGIALLFWLESRRRAAGHCPACGYDLRGLSERRCPECGRQFTFAEVRKTPDELGFVGPVDR